MRRALPVVLAALSALACAGERSRETVRIDRADRIRVPSPQPPAPADPRWERVRLPDWWGVRARRESVEGWYRATVRIDQVPTEVWGVYLPRIGQHASVLVNRVSIGESGPLGPPLPRNWNRPQLFSVPASLLRPGANEVLVRLVTHIGAPGFLRDFHVGPMRVLAPMHATRTWRQVTLGQIVGGATLAGGLLLLGFASRHARFRPHRILALGLVLWSWTLADAFFQSTPIASRWWEASTSAALVWCVTCFTFGFHRLLGFERPRIERLVLAIALGYSLSLVALPPIFAFGLGVVGGALAVGIALYLIAILVRAPTSGRAFGRVLLLPAVVGVLFGVHDLVLVATGEALLGMLLSPYIPIVAMAATGWMLLDRHLASLEETEALNAELEGRVEAKHRELEENYERLGALERQHAIVGERERIMQDMHDGMGGQLVSTLAMVESGAWTPEQVGDALRDALDDLRIVIDSLDPAEQDLLTVLGMVRARMEPRLLRHGLRFRWRVAEVPPLGWFGPEMALQVMRIVQEAITNVVKHADASTITVRTGEGNDERGRPGVLVDVEDDGRGVAPDAPAGRGLAGMRRRAERLGGAVTVDAVGGGTRVRIWLPVGADAA